MQGFLWFIQVHSSADMWSIEIHSSADICEQLEYVTGRPVVAQLQATQPQGLWVYVCAWYDNIHEHQPRTSATEACHE